MTPFLAPDEQLAWYNMKTSGTFTKKVDWVQALTSFRVLEYNFKSHQSTSLPLSLVDNAIVTNRRTVSQTSQNGLFVGSGSNAAVIQGSAKSTSVTVGDVIFTQSGKNYMTFSQVQDPDGVADVFQSTKCVILSEEEYHQHMNPNITLPPNVMVVILKMQYFAINVDQKFQPLALAVEQEIQVILHFAINVESNFRLIEILDQSLKTTTKHYLYEASLVSDYMNFGELKEFISNKMLMQHVYQPVIIKTLLQSDNKASVREIAQSFLQLDESQIIKVFEID